jgi:hypothetical protein
MATVKEQMEARLKCKAYKNEETPDDRRTLCGEPLKVDENGRQYFEIPDHQREYIAKMLTSYTVSESYDIENPPVPKKAKVSGYQPRSTPIKLDEE